MVAAGLLKRFDKISGIELLDGLYYESIRIKDKYVKITADTTTHFNIVQGNFLDEQNDWWLQSDFIYMNNIFDGEALIDQIGQKASAMKQGSWFVTLFKPMPVDPEMWQLKLCKYMEMSWGSAPIHVHYKLK